MNEQTEVVQYQAAREVDRFLPVMSLQIAVERREAIVSAVKMLMKEDQDFGTIPGTPKPTLYQPGADKLCNLFGLVPTFETIEKDLDWTGERHGGEPFFFYTTKCQLYRGTFLMGEGEGSCNSWEAKYRWRKSERVCPACWKSSIIKGKAEYGGGWLCFAKKGGCGAKYKAGDASIEGQSVGSVPNPDIADLVNTILKIANKRAKVAATLNATSAHEFFTQDVEDIQMPSTNAEPETPRETHDELAARRIAEETAKIEAKKASKASKPVDPPSPFQAMLKTFEKAKAKIGSAHYYRILGEKGYQHSNELPDLATGEVLLAEMRDVAKAEAQFHATDADLPAELQGERQ